MSSFNLLQPTEIFNISIISYAILIDQQFGSMLIPNEEGIYKLGDTEPSVVPRKRYYSIKVINGVKGDPELITNFSSVRDHVINENGVMTIPNFMMQNQERFLSAQPTVPARSASLLEYIILSHLSSICPYESFNRYIDKIANHFLPGYDDVYKEGYLERLCSSLLDQIDSFIGKDTWHIYFLRRNQLEIRLEKTIDYRVHQWNLHQQAIVDAAAN